MKRREFVKSAALATGALVSPISLKANSERIKLAILGTGWWGTDILLANAIKSGHFEIVGLCDVDRVALEKAATLVTEAGGARPQLFSSHSDLFKMPGLQAVAIATPTHWHALQFIEACDKGLDVFLEKPISYDIKEGLAMLKAHRRAKNVVVVDFPRVMTDINPQVKEYIDSGEAGRILQVEANINTGGVGKLVEKEIPASLDFETYCGPVPLSTYLCGGKSTKINWRGQHIFNRGIMVDWGIHYIHNARVVMGLGLPDNVAAIGGITGINSIDNPDHLDVRFEFDGLPVYWSHKEWGFKSPLPRNNHGVFYYGEKATVFAGDFGWEVYNGKTNEKIVHGDIRFRPNDEENWSTVLKMMTDQFDEFAKGIRSNSNIGISNTFEEGHLTTSTVIYGDMSYRTGSLLEINPSSFEIENNQEAGKGLKRNYRSPYQHPADM